MKATLENGEQLEATSGHPFYVQGKGWNAAANLKVGDALLLHNGTTQNILRSKQTEKILVQRISIHMKMLLNVFLRQAQGTVQSLSLSKR